MKEQDADYEERRRQAFLEYQKTGKMNEIVAKEIAAYEREANKGNRRMIYASLAVFLLLYVGIFVLLWCKFLQTFHGGWGILCACCTFVTGVAIYVIVRYYSRKRKQ